jgi:FixJ family two-component response regulator
MTNEKPSVFVVDDDLSVREALSSLIRSVRLHVEMFASAGEFQARLARPPEGAECLVLDVRMPGMNGLDLQRELAVARPSMPIIFITGHGDIPMTVRAMKAGAVEFLPKPFREQELLDAIGAALARSGELQREFGAVAEVRSRFDTLSAREREVLALLVKGLRNKQSADQLGISEVTVKVHRHNIMEKMGASSLQALLAMVGRLGP